MTTKAIFRKDAINKKGEASINIRITVDRKRSYLNTGLKIHKDHWDQRKGLVKRINPNYKLLNHKLKKLIHNIEEAAIQFDLSEKKYNAKLLKKVVEDKNPNCFIKFGKEWMQARYERNDISYGSLVKYKSHLAKLDKYTDCHLSFDEVTYDFLNSYSTYLHNSLGNGTNTVNTNMKCIRAIVNEAIRQDEMKVNHNPFIKFKLKTEEVKREALTQSELDMIIELNLPDGSRLKASRDIFIFCTQSGLRIGDALRLRKSEYDGSIISHKSQKTKSYQTTYLTQLAIDILNSYLGSTNTEYVFPFLSHKEFGGDAEALKTLKSKTALINKNLKIIAERVGLNKSLSTHIGRHSFAVSALTKGLQMEEIKGLLGHRDIQTTQIYAKVVDKMEEEAIRKFENSNRI